MNDEVKKEGKVNEMNLMKQLVKQIDEIKSWNVFPQPACHPLIAISWNERINQLAMAAEVRLILIQLKEK